MRKGRGGGDEGEGEGEEADEGDRLERSGDKRCQDSKYQQILLIPVFITNCSPYALIQYATLNVKDKHTLEKRVSLLTASPTGQESMRSN